MNETISLKRRRIFFRNQKKKKKIINSSFGHKMFVTFITYLIIFTFKGYKNIKRSSASGLVAPGLSNHFHNLIYVHEAYLILFEYVHPSNNEKFYTETTCVFLSSFFKF